MSLRQKTDIIVDALHKLGYRSIRELRIDNPVSELTNVYLNGDYFGIYDFTRRTFVD